MDERFFCDKCKKTMNANMFYSSNNLEKYPLNGKLNQCKKCLTMHVDNWNPDTYMWILQECDVPYVPDEWNKLLEKYGKNSRELTGMTIVGRYLSKMKLIQYRDYRWKDTKFLQELKNAKVKQAMKDRGCDAQEITTTIENMNATIPEPEKEIPIPQYEDDEPEDYFDKQSRGSAEDDSDDFVDDLTDEDRTYLRLKWGKAYKPEEWVRLEQFYEEMKRSYDIQGAGHEDNLKLLCKTSLKANQLIDIGDIEGFQKMSKVYDNLMKSGRFTAAQNKAASGEFIDSISELVEICEKEGFIPRYYTDGPQDKVDKTLLDLQSYTRDLITEETNLGQMIEKAMEQIKKDKENEASLDVDDNEDEEAFEEQLFSDQAEKILRDDDFAEFSEFESNLALEDEDFLKKLHEGSEI